MNAKVAATRDVLQLAGIPSAFLNILIQPLLFVKQIAAQKEGAFCGASIFRVYIRPAHSKYKERTVKRKELGKMKKYVLLRMTLLSVVVILAAGCANQNEEAHQLDYEETKKMVVDILKTDEGKKALQEAIKDKEVRREVIMDEKVIKETVQTTLTSDKGKEFWQKAFEDPKFAETFAKSMKKEHEALLKELMKDPDYQKMLIDVMKDPEMQKTMQTAMKSQEFRKYLQGVIEETLASPLYKAKMEEAIKKAAEEAQKKEQGGS